MAAPIRMETKHLRDCHHFGSSRYAYQGGTGGGSSPAGSTVLRRCISMPFGPIFEAHIIVQLLRLEHQQLRLVQGRAVRQLLRDRLAAPSAEVGPEPEDLKWGSFYHPKSVRNVEHIGCGVINCGAEYGGIRYDNYGGAGAALGSIVDCFVVGFNNGSPGSAGALEVEQQQGIHHELHGHRCAWRLCRHRWLTLTSNLTSGITYPVLRRGGNGAEQKYAIGAFLSERGDANYKTVQTSMKLWPFPYEDVIASVFSESITRVTQDVPTGVSASASPFAGVDQRRCQDLHAPRVGIHRQRDAEFCAWRGNLLMAIVANDTFTDANGTNITSRNSDSGHSWTTAPGSTGAVTINQTRPSMPDLTDRLYSFYTPPSADYSVS